MNPLYYKVLVSKLTVTVDQVDLNMDPYSGRQCNQSSSCHITIALDKICGHLVVKRTISIASQEMLGIVRCDISGDG